MQKKTHLAARVHYSVYPAIAPELKEPKSILRLEFRPILEPQLALEPQLGLDLELDSLLCSEPHLEPEMAQASEAEALPLARQLFRDRRSLE